MYMGGKYNLHFINVPDAYLFNCISYTKHTELTFNMEYF